MITRRGCDDHGDTRIRDLAPRPGGDDGRRPAQGSAFYRDVPGLRFLFEAPPAMAFFDCGGIRLMLSLPEQAGPVAGQQFGSILYYVVDEIQQAARALEARGVLFEQPPHVVARLPHADLWMAFLRDPDGTSSRS